MNLDQLKIQHGSLGLNPALLLTWLRNRKILCICQGLLTLCVPHLPLGHQVPLSGTGYWWPQCKASVKSSSPTSCPCSERSLHAVPELFPISHRAGIRTAGACIHGGLSAWRSQQLTESSWPACNTAAGCANTAWGTLAFPESPIK